MTQRTDPVAAATVDDLVGDARALGLPATKRLIWDWQSLGLLDYPTSQGGLGRGGGSRKALYSANQRHLFWALESKRSEVTRVALLTKIPVYRWLYWGDEHVPLRQTRLALATWVRAFESPSQETAHKTAQATAAAISHADASTTAVHRFTRLLSDTLYAKQPVSHDLTDAMRSIVDPHQDDLRIGPRWASVTVEEWLLAFLAGRVAAGRILADDLPDQSFLDARSVLQNNFLDYLLHQPQLLARAGTVDPASGPAVIEELIQNICGILLQQIGLPLAAPRDRR